MIRRNVLIVDDNILNRMLLSKALSDEYDITEAENGIKALEIISKNYKTLSAVLLDIVMPEMNGYEVLQHVRDNALFSQLPIIMVTGSEDEESRIKALSYGANDFILKPFNPEIVKHCLKNNIALNEAFATVNALKRDSLTGLYTRAAFFDLVKTMVDEKKAGYYIMASFDIDRFTAINDSYGPQKGDEVLKHIASVLKEGFSACGGICCRVSGDKFAILYPTEFCLSKELELIKKKVANVEGLIAPLDYTVGRYTVTDVTILPVAMYDRAVLAANTIKGKYGERVAVYDEKMRARAVREQEIVTQMEKALKTRQFEAWFQPQINHTTGALVGAEALARWRHPQKGLISPAEFIPIFEQNGFIYELDKFIWEEVCLNLRKWLDEGFDPVPVSVNISRYDIFKPGFIDVLPSLVKKYDLPVDLLRIEITESAFSQSLDTIVDIVKKLIGLGFTIEIDDFGSGYSSLNTLKHVPAQVVKLDMRFLEDGDDDKRGGNILESIVRMTKWLGMSVIAEGVEHKKQADYMESIGCCYIQGYYYARPMPIDEYEAFCRSVITDDNIMTIETVENFNSNSLWDPNSMDTLIFSSFVGAACIFEYHNRNIELLRANRKFTAILGDGTMPVADILKLNWISCLSPESLDLVHDILNRSLETREEYTAEYEFLNIPGAPPKLYLRATMRVIASTGARMLVYCTSENITAQRQAEENELAAVEKKMLASDQLQAILDHVEVGIVASLDNGKTVDIMFANDKFYQMLGYTRENYAAEVKDPLMLFVPEERDWIRAQIAARIADGEPDVIDCHMIRRDGTRRFIRDAFSICSFTGINTPVQLSIFRDITEEVQSEIENMRTTEQIHLIMRDVNCGITAAVLDDEGNISLLFTNDKFFEIHGYTREEYMNRISDKYSLIHPLDREKAKEDTVAAYKKRIPAILEYRLVKKDNTICWVRVNLSSTHFTGIDQNVQLCIFTDITDEKLAQQTILETDEQLRFLSDMSHELLAKADVEEGINASLYRLMEYFQGNRAYIFEFDDERRMAVNTYEVCGKNISVQINKLKNVPFELGSSWFDAFENEGYYAIENVSALDESHAEEKKQLAALGINSLFVVPIKRDGKLIGMLGVDDSRRKLTQLNLMRSLGDYIAVMLTRRDLNKQISNDNKVLTDMMNDMPGGFVRMLVTNDNTLKPFYFNNGFSHLTGMDRDELKEIYLDDIHVGIHPDDLAVVDEAIKKMLSDGKAHSSRYRLRHKNGGYIWVATFGRITVNQLNQAVLNTYFFDMTDQDNIEKTK